MDVWVVVYDSIGYGEDMRPYGVFDSREKADAWAKQRWHYYDVYRFTLNVGKDDPGFGDEDGRFADE